MLEQRPWHSETKIKKEDIRQLLEKQFPEITPINSIDFLGSGWDNCVYRINKKYVFRFPRRECAIEEINNEITVLPFLAPLLPVAITKPLFIGKPTKLYSRPFCGHNYLEGKHPKPETLSKKESIMLSQDLAHSLKTLHSLDEQWAHKHQVGPDPRKINFSERISKAHELVETIKKLNLEISFFDFSLILEFITKVPDLFKDLKPYVVVHGDLYGKHTLIDKQNRLSAIIDWGDVHLGPRGLDLSIAYTLFSRDIRINFFNAYGPIDKITTLLGLCRAAHLSLWLTVYGNDTNDSYLLKEGTRGIHHIQEELKESNFF